MLFLSVSEWTGIKKEEKPKQRGDSLTGDTLQNVVFSFWQTLFYLLALIAVIEKKATQTSRRIWKNDS